MTITIKNIRPFMSGKVQKLTNITITNGSISAIGSQLEGEIVDGCGNICSAGYIDIHTHGGWGKDCMEANFETLDTISKYHLSTGITTFVPTTMTASPADINLAVDNIRQFCKQGKGYARIFGAHLEGPYLSQKSAGAHPPQFLLNPTKDNQNFVWDNLDIVKRITVAPNLVDSAEFCQSATSRGIQISLGHDNSIDDEIYACVDNGANSVTHMYNCTSRPSRRENPKKHLGLTEIGLIDSRIVCEVIADDRHVPNALFDMIFKLKGSDKICLVSDSLSVAGMPAGDYYLGSGESKQAIRVEDGVAVLPKENTYAGSVTPISKMAQMLFARGYKVEDCLAMATIVPSKLMKMTDRGDIAVGMLGDLNILDDKLMISKTFVGGEEYKG